jgi:L,D-transpeptidase catalytic domain
MSYGRCRPEHLESVPPMARLLPFFLLLALAAPATAAAAAPPLRPKDARGPLGNATLSNERTLTRWAHTNLIESIRAWPDKRAHRIGRLHWDTEDGPPEVYVVLASHVDAGTRTWLRIRVPGRPNGRTGWVREDALSQLYVVETQLVVDRRRFTATLYKRGEPVWRSRVGVGAPGTPTPAGRFWIREKLRNLGGSPLYGPWAFGTAAYSNELTDWPGGGVVGMHGTDQPYLIPGRPSHGCVRVPNDRIRKLARLLPVGTPLRIR